MDAIVLGRKDVGEYNQWVVCLSRKYGKQQYLMRGVKKITSKNAAHIEPCSFIDATVVSGKDLDILTTSYLQDSFPPIQQDYVKRLMADTILRIVDLLTISGEDGQVFDVLLLGLSSLCTEPIVSAVRWIDLFMLQLSEAIGIVPVLDCCCVCGKSRDETNTPVLSVLHGGVVCRGCVGGVGKSYAPKERLYLLKNEADFHAFMHHHVNFHLPQDIFDWGDIEKWLK
jgi:DNA repair protein RecO (recombination protein O)